MTHRKRKTLPNFIAGCSLLRAEAEGFTVFKEAQG
jgi:hypothetical protein